MKYSTVPGARRRTRRGAALIEYSLLVAGVALVALAAVAIFGHKTSDLISATAAALPGSHADDIAPIVSAKIVDTTQDSSGNAVLDIQSSVDGNNVLGDNLGLTNLEDLVVEIDPGS